MTPTEGDPPAMTIFDEATAVSRRGEGLYDAEPDARFALVAPGGNVPPAVNGGALLATVLRAVLDCSPTRTRSRPARISSACRGWRPPRWR